MQKPVLPIQAEYSVPLPQPTEEGKYYLLYYGATIDELPAEIDDDPAWCRTLYTYYLLREPDLSFDAPTLHSTEIWDHPLIIGGVSFEKPITNAAPGALLSVKLFNRPGQEDTPCFADPNTLSIIGYLDKEACISLISRSIEQRLTCYKRQNKTGDPVLSLISPIRDQYLSSSINERSLLLASVINYITTPDQPQQSSKET